MQWKSRLAAALAILLPALLHAAPLHAAGAGDRRADTRFGPVQVTRPDDGGFGAGVRVGGVPLAGIAGREVAIEGVWRGAAGDLVLLRVDEGGNGSCSGYRAIVAVSAGGARATPPFGECGGDLLAARADGGRIELDVAAADPHLSHVTYRYDRGAVSAEPVARRAPEVPEPGAGTEVSRWSGRHPWQVLRDDGERRRLLSIMPPGKLSELEARVAVAEPARIVRGWLVAGGCMAHGCPGEAGAFAIEIETGRAIAVIRRAGAAPELYGTPPVAMPPAMVSFIGGSGRWARTPR